MKTIQVRKILEKNNITDLMVMEWKRALKYFRKYQDSTNSYYPISKQDFKNIVNFHLINNQKSYWDIIDCIW